MRLPERTRAFITGGGGGLGRALAAELARARRARVLVTDVDGARAEETAAVVRANGGEAETFACDVTRPDDLVRGADAMDRRFGGTDLLVNNAGVAVAGAVGEVPLDDWRWIVDVNLWGVIHGCHAFVPRLRARGEGFVLNVASSAGIACLPDMGPYNVTKAGVIALSETLAAELATCGVTVTALCPTFFTSGIVDGMRATCERQSALAAGLLRWSNVPAERVARAAIRALEAGRLVEIPQVDGRLAWRVKRLVPQRFARSVGRIYRSGWFERWSDRMAGGRQGT